jgi:hypothetical protein
MRALLTLDSRRLAEERKACTADADEPGTIGRPSNRLGRIVFMGTPFYHKRWVVSRHRGARFLAYLAGCLLAAPALFGLTWLVMPLFGLIFHSLTFTAWNVVTRFGMGPYWVRSIGWNVFTWPKWLIGLWLGMCVLFVLIGYRESRRFNTNMYFSSNSAFRKEPAEPSGWRPERLPCLVISANLLDEALLALSAEALVYALLVPRVWDLLGLAPRSWGDMLSAASGHRPPAGAEEPQSVAGYRELTLLGIGGVLLLLYLVLVHWWWRYVVRLLLAPRAVALLMGVITTAAFGVPASELRRSRIEVSSSLDMPEVFDVEEWLVGDEVLKQSTSASLPPVSAKETWKGYQHLVDAAELERKITESAKAHSVFSWQRVEAFIPEIYERYRQSFALEASGGGLDLPEFSRHLARVWFTLLERGKEMTGAVELNHSVYYANPQVIRRVAAFLAGGE